MKSFPPDIIPQLKFYVYLLIDPRNNEVFYVGKGSGNRVFAHQAKAIKDTGNHSEELDRIREILAAGKQVDVRIAVHGVDEKTAFTVETVLIDLFNAPFMNFLTNRQRGHGSSVYGGCKTLDEIVEQYSLGELKEAPGDKLIFINISRSHNEDKSIYDAVRGNWTMQMSRAKQANYVLAVYEGVVVGVFAPNDWHATNEGKRIAFTGTEANSP